MVDDDLRFRLLTPLIAAVSYTSDVSAVVGVRTDDILGTSHMKAGVLSLLLMVVRFRGQTCEIIVSWQVCSCRILFVSASPPTIQRWIEDIYSNHYT